MCLVTMPGLFLTATVTVCEPYPQCYCEDKMFMMCLHSEKTSHVCKKVIAGSFFILPLPKV